MRIRPSTGILLALFAGSLVATLAIPPGVINWVAVGRLAASLTLIVSGAGLVARGIKAIRDTILGRRRAERAMFPPGRCHACGYDTSALVRGIVACPECGVILASIPSGSAAPRRPD